MTAIRDLNANFAEKATQLEQWAQEDSLLKTEAQELLADFNAEYENPKDLLQLLHETKRVSTLFVAGAQNNAALIADLENTTSPLWKDVPDLPIDQALQKRVAEQFKTAPLTKPDPNINVNLTPYAPLIGEEVIDGLVKDGRNFDVNFTDGDWMKRLLDGLDNEAIGKLSANAKKNVERMDKRFHIGALTPDSKVEPDETKKKLYEADWRQIASNKSRSVDNFFTLTYIPTPEDAKIDGMEYESYLKLFFELCDQPWKQIEAAQEKLIEMFDNAKELHITNDDGTDITLNIEGQTFCNSVVKKNIPGSEIFSAPKRDGVNGTLVSKGKFMPKDGGGEIVENMTLKFVDGEVVEARAEKGEAALKEVLATDEGARFPGEIGIGTNPWLKQHVMNGLLVEKISGSFHIAMGACYDYDQYDGKPVNVKNGNDSKIHWDVTTMLLGHGGKMYLDGELIQENGKYLTDKHPEFRVFNEGWKAVPPKERPGYWQDRLKGGSAREVAGETQQAAPRSR